MGRKVQMTVTMSGARADGRPWPAAGLPLVVDDWEAEHLVRGDMARYVADAPPAPEPVNVQVAFSPEQGVLEPAGPPEPEAQDSVDVPAPKPVQPKADWVAWAVAQGADEEEANGLTKAELMERYGDRA